MPKIPPVSAVQIIKILQRQGFTVARQKGSHAILINNEKTRIVVPIHPGKDLKPGLTSAIIREAGISHEKFLKLLKEE